MSCFHVDGCNGFQLRQDVRAMKVEQVACSLKECLQSLHKLTQANKDNQVNGLKFKSPNQIPVGTSSVLERTVKYFLVKYYIEAHNMGISFHILKSLPIPKSLFSRDKCHLFNTKQISD